MPLPWRTPLLAYIVLPLCGFHDTREKGGAHEAAVYVIACRRGQFFTRQEGVNVQAVSPDPSPLFADARILILDDEVVNVRLLKRMLERAGYTHVRGSSDSHHIVRDVLHWHPDLLLLDLHMPGVDGFAILQELHRHASSPVNFPVLVLTGDGSESVKARALAFGARDFVVKPFGVTEMLLRIRNLLETHFLHQQLKRENQSLGERVREKELALDRAQTEILERLSYAAEFRDDDTGQHTRRVGQLSASIAAELRLPEERIEEIRRAAPLHDVGKIGIPDSILLKPGRLSSQEFEIIKLHTTIGAKILSGGPTGLITLAEEIARAHHERWDGTGYPGQVAGEAIPQSARIVAVADFYDALTSDRPYRKAWTPSDAIQEIDREAGSHFDPGVVDAFFTVMSEAL